MEEVKGDAAGLPDLVLLRVLSLLPENDVVSVGQVCRRWRQVARRGEVWRGRGVDAAGDQVADGRVVCRVLRFAPCLTSLSVAATSWSSHGHAARAAVKCAQLQPGCKVERLTDLWCHMDSLWAVSLLTVRAEQLVEVSVFQVDLAVLETLHAMALHQALRGLLVWHCHTALHVDTVAIPDGEEGSCRGLERLDIFDLPQVTIFSLLRAHRRTLREVTLHVGTSSLTCSSDWRRTRRSREEDGLQLSSCGLQQLRHLRLDRYGRAHPLPACAAQLAGLRAVLPPGATVTCRQCEEDAGRPGD